MRSKTPQIRKAIPSTTFKKVEAKNPIKEPIAAFNARETSRLSNINSPIKAPRNGPKIKPNGMGAMIPMIRPILVPQMPYLLPPKRLVHCAGMT